ncbi:hypothetical protein WMY93_026153 [Mugilogobius chulae]|uniref:Peptide-N-glycosidase F N-terminal domain-containing protein n=1 Tax=Mugilogobius chulae TaxID=88201 RepID=A0AAW0MWN8_9GOBI
MARLSLPCLVPLVCVVVVVSVTLTAHVTAGELERTPGRRAERRRGALTEEGDSERAEEEERGWGRKPHRTSPNSLEPGDPAPAFTVPTLDGPFQYEPGVFRGSLIIHAFTNQSAFLESVWGSEEALVPLVQGLPESAHVLLMSLDDSAVSDVLWMREQLYRAATRAFMDKSVLSRLHFCPLPVFLLGNWIPAVLYSWMCSGHNCGLPQAVFSSSDWKLPVVAKRLDARYDWLMGRWGQTSYSLADGGDGCAPSAGVKGAVAWVSEGGCSYFTKVQNMARSNASGVLVYDAAGQPVRDMTCEGTECEADPPNVPAAMVHLEPSVVQALRLGQPVNVSFQTTPSPNFFISIDQQGALAEMGWFLYPTFSFINWQAQWFDFRTSLLTKLQSPATVLSVFDKVHMQGDAGAQTTVQLPSGDWDTLELDVSLSCPSSRDSSCPQWDHTVQLFVCCDPHSEMCNLELGRWITAFRRGIGHWLTDVSPLLPLLDSSTCTFTMKTVPWAMLWIVSLNLRRNSSASFRVTSLYSGGTFDKDYNKRYQPFKFTVPVSAKKVELYAVITGHGSDENGCGEFCVTSHHFTVNSVYNNTLTFNTAGSPLGCTLKVPEGAVPNEHGTWLYGRGGWCDGLQVDPWRVDLTSQVDLSGSSNRCCTVVCLRVVTPAPPLSPGTSSCPLSSSSTIHSSSPTVATAALGQTDRNEAPPTTINHSHTHQIHNWQYTSPSHRETGPSQRETSPSQRETSPSQRETSPSQRETSPSKVQVKKRQVQVKAQVKERQVQVKERQVPSQRGQVQVKERQVQVKERQVQVRERERETSPSQRERQVQFKERDKSNSKRETSPSQRETSPSERETSPSQRETNPSQRETSPSQRETSPCQRETSPSQRETSPSQAKSRETSPSQRETSPKSKRDKSKSKRDKSNSKRRQVQVKERQVQVRERERETSPSQRERQVQFKERDKSNSKRETSPSQRETSPSQRETNPSQRETSPSQRETSPSQRETSPSQRETSPSQRETGPSQRETSPGQVPNFVDEGSVMLLDSQGSRHQPPVEREPQRSHSEDCM